MMIQRCSLTVLFLVLFTTAEMFPQNWRNAASMNAAREATAAVLLADGRVLICGGGPNPESAYVSAEIFDYRDNSVRAAADMPRPLRGHKALLLVDGRVFVAGGGASSDQVQNFCLIYDPARDLWTEVAPMNSRRRNFSFVRLIDGRVMALGGVGGAAGTSELKSLNSCEIYDPAADAWALTARMNTARNSMKALVLDNGLVLTPNGFSTENDYSRDCQLYNPTTDSWAATGAFQGPATGGHSTTHLLDGRVLRTGGWPGPQNSSELYDPAAGKWSTAGQLNRARYGHALVGLGNAKVLAIGGVVTGGGQSGQNSTNSVEMFDPESEAWSDVDPLPRSLVAPRAVTLPNGNVALFGGYSLTNDSRGQASDAIIVSDFDDLNPRAYVSGTVWYDIDQDGKVGINDEPAVNTKIVALPGPYFGTTDTDGNYELRIPLGQYSICRVDAANWQTAWPDAGGGCYEVELEAFDQRVNKLDFGLTAERQARELEVSIVSTRPSVGAALTYYLTFRNSGTVAYSGELNFEFDALLQFVNSSVAPSSQVDSRLSWGLQDFPVGESNAIVLEFNVPDDNSLIDTELCGLVRYDIDAGSEVLRGGQDKFCERIRGQHSPNAIQVSPVGQGSGGALFYADDLTLSYTVYFQNLGSSVVADMRISVRLDGDLDWASFAQGPSSHPTKAQVDANGELTLNLQDVNLQPSGVSEAESRGYVRYFIKPNKPSTEVAEIPQFANIDFGAGSSEFSNGVLTTIVKVVSTVDDVVVNKTNVSLYPNPVTEALTVSGIEELADALRSVSVVDQLGRVQPVAWKRQAGNVEIDVRSLRPGAYWLNLEFDDLGRVARALQIVR